MHYFAHRTRGGDLEPSPAPAEELEVSRAKNVDPFASAPHSLYTSTPRKKHSDSFYSQFVQVTNNLCVGGGGVGVTFDPRLKQLVIIFAILIIGYKSVILTMPYINASNIQQVGQYVQVARDWSEKHQLGSRLSPLLWGLLITIFSYGLVYLDSAEPGISPPSPFSKQTRSQRQKKGISLHLNYLGAFLAGSMVTLVMYFNLWNST
ncbi:uncharacterized protein [Drosophila tropicalis]|uniref:uncharacterized protein n=1 Tax=Drosophila tropicalis TaxID=46794 RepID=UPI0035AC05A8